MSHFKKPVLEIENGILESLEQRLTESIEKKIITNMEKFGSKQNMENQYGENKRIEKVK